MADDKVLRVEAKKSENFSDWYVQVITRSGFIDYSDVSGCIVFKPHAYGTWQLITEAVDRAFKKDGVENSYFPMLIPEKLLQKEQDHLKGFIPEVAWVTHTGNTELDQKLAIRPTSEAIMYSSYSKWIRSWRDLPLRYNQWNSVLRWEFKHPTPFIRSREFLWNEGHSAFATKEEAIAERERIISIYLDTLQNYLALPGIVGKKSETEKFAGAVETYSIEHIMPDGWAIQGPDHHFDGQNFSKAFDIKFLDKNEKIEYAWQTTYAITTRVLGIMVATHGDDKGLVVPPRVAYIQIVIVPIYRKDNQELVNKHASKLYEELREKFRTRLDDRSEYSPGFKFNEWELKGVPMRIEIGEKDIAVNSVVIVRRDTGEKMQVKVAALSKSVEVELERMHADMYKKAKEAMASMIHVANSLDEFKKVLKEKGGIITSPWCGDAACELKMKEENGTKITNLPVEHPTVGDRCIYCGKQAKHVANFARSY